MSENAGSVRVCAVIRGESAGEEVNIGLFTEEQTAKGITVEQQYDMLRPGVLFLEVILSL